MTRKTEFVALRATPEQVRKLRAMALATGHGLNVSQALRSLVDSAPEPNISDILSGIQARIAAGEQHG